MESDSISYKEESFLAENKVKLLISGGLWAIVFLALCFQ